MTEELKVRFANITEPATGKRILPTGDADRVGPPTGKVAQTPTPKPLSPPKKEKETPKHGLNTDSFTF